MKRIAPSLVVLYGAFQPVHAQPATSLTVRVENMDSRGGVLRLGLYEKAQYEMDGGEPVASSDVAAGISETTIVLKNLKPGVYAIEVFQDLNANGKMDYSWLGIPEEPYGFSRDARPVLSQPSFARAAFVLDPGENLQTLRLQGPVRARPSPP